MTKLALYDFKSEKKDAVEVNADIFDVEVKNEVLHLAVTAYLAAGRAGSASAKTRGEIRGGGAKPWKQKGTGRARAGTNTSPLWKGGGVIFGPKPRSFEKKLNKKVKKLALKMALSAKKDETLIIRDFNIESAKTKDAVEKLNKAEVVKKSLIVLNDKNDNTIKATNNIPNIKVIMRNQLNVYDILKYEKVCIDENVLNTLQKELV